MRLITIKSAFLTFIVLALILNSQQVFAHGVSAGGPVMKTANTTLHIHDDIEAHQMLHKDILTRKRKTSFLSK